MNKIVIAAILAMFASNIAFADDANCDAKAAEKKLSGAAKNSFIKKCTKDAAIAACGTTAALP
jgi:hypothetical protein